MRVDGFAFGSIRIDGLRYPYDVVIDRSRVRKRKKKHSKAFRNAYGHTPLSVREDIPWKCSELIIGTGAMGALPVMDEVLVEAMRRNVKLQVMPTKAAIATLVKAPKETNAILHVTC